MARSKITETGPRTYLDLLRQNKELLEGAEQESSLSNMRFNFNPRPTTSYISEKLEYSPIYLLSGGKDYWGNSAWDEDNLTVDLWDTLLENPNEYRAERQPWYALLGAGILKGTALAGTTFLDGTLGLLYGIGSAADTWIDGGSFSEGAGELFNNKLSKGLRTINEYMEEALPVYRTLDEIENPMALRNLFSMSTIADDFIKNMGFTVGAFYSGNAYLGAIKGINNLVKAGQLSSTAAKVIGSTLSGINEGRIEAGHLVDDMCKSGETSLMETYRPLYEQIMSEPDTLEVNPETGIATSSRKRKLDELLDRLNTEKENLKLRATRAGLMDLIFNSVYLPLNDYYTYGKLYARGFNAKKDLANKVRKSADDIIELATKEELFNDRIIKDASGKYISKPVSKSKSALKGAKIFGVEGSEEMNLALFTSLSTNYYTPDSPDAYYQALTNDEYEMNTKDFMTSLTLGIKDSWGKGDAYKEFLIGGLNGIIGMPTFGKVNNSDHNTWLGRGKMIGMSGGMFGEMSNDTYYNQLALAATNAMNNFIDKVNNSKMFFTRSQSFADAMDGYSEANDKFEFENAKDNDIFNVIDAYGRTGRILDLYDLVNQDFEDLSEERLREIALDTESSTNEWRNVDGTLMSDSEEGRQLMTLKLLEKRESIIDGIKSYEKALLKVRSISNNSLTEDLNAELAWLAWKQDRFTDRFNSIKEEQQQFIDKLAKATDTFLRGRGIGALTLNIEDVAPEIEEYDDLGRITGTRRKTNEEKQKEVETGQSIKKSMEVVSLFLNILNLAESPLQLSYFVKGNPKISLFIDDIGFDLLEGIIPMTYDEYTEGMATLKDAARIATAHKSFSDRYREFTDNPSKVILNREKIELEKQKVDNVKGRKNVADEIRNTSVGDLARSADNGDIDLDYLSSLVKEVSESRKGSNLQDTLYLNEADKIEEAKRFNLTREDLINGILNNDQLTEEEINDAISLISTTYSRADTVDDLVDLNRESYNDARNLPISDTVSELEMSSRLDNARNAINMAIQSVNNRREVSRDIPSSSDIPVLPIDRGTTNSRDPLDISETELERISRERREEEETQRREAQRKSISQSWNNLVAQAFNQSELPPVFSEDILKVIKPLVDDAIDSGLTDNQMMLVLNDDNTFKSLNTMTKGGLLNAVLLYKEAKKNSSVQSTSKASDSLTRLKDNTSSEVSGIKGQEIKETEEPSVDRGTPTPDITNYTNTAAPKLDNDGLPTDFGKKQYIAPSLRKSIPDREGNISNYEDSPEAKQRYITSTLDRMKVIREFLEKRNAFDNVDNDVIKVGDKLSLVVYPEVIDSTGELVIFMLTSDGKIVGDLPSKLYSTTKDYAGLLDLITRIEQSYAEWIKDESNKNKPFIYKDFTPIVTLNLIGKVVYTKGLQPLNTIFGNKLQLALCLTENGLFQMLYDGGKTKKSRTTRDNQVMLPLNPTSGMPYVLVESSDPNRKYVPVPFRMDRYDGNTNTMLGKAIRSAVNDIITENAPSESLKDALLDLVALEDAWLEINGDNVTFRIKRQGATLFETIINNEPRTVDLIDRIIDSLKGNPYQVSRKYINGDYEYFENGVPVKVKYNQMIGEIATTNIGATHTQGDWFITEPATGTASNITSLRNNPNHRATITEFTFNNASYTITKYGPNGVESWVVKDSEGNVINDDNLRAFGYGIHKVYPMDKQYNVPWSVTVDRNGEAIPTSIYSPKSNKYILPPLTSTIDLNAAMALLRGEENRDLRVFGNPYIKANGTGVPLKVLLEIAEANAEARRTLGERRLALEHHPFIGEPLQEGDITEARIDTINGVLQDFLNSRKAEKNKLFPEKSPWQEWREFYSDRNNLAPLVTEVDRLIMTAVLEDRRNRKTRDLQALILEFVKLAGLTSSYSEETVEGQPLLEIQISSGEASTEIPEAEISKYKIGDNLEGIGGVWQVTSINEDGSITLKSLTTEILLKVSGDSLSLFSTATNEAVQKVIQEVIDETHKPITSGEIKDAIKSSPIRNVLSKILDLANSSWDSISIELKKGGIGMAGSPELIKNKIKYLQSIIDLDNLTIEDYSKINSLLDDIYGALNTLVSGADNGKNNIISESLIRDLANAIVNKFGISQVSSTRDKYLNHEEGLGRGGTASTSQSIYNSTGINYEYINNLVDWLYSAANNFIKNDRSSDIIRISMPSYFSSMKSLLGGKKSTFDYYLEDGYRKAEGTVVGPAMLGTLSPVITLALDSNILPTDFEDLRNKNVVDYNRIKQAVDVLKSYNINSPQELLDFIENNQTSSVLQVSPIIQQVLNNFSGYFEGGGRVIQDDFPGFNEQLAAKFEDYIMGNGEFTEDDAIEFLNEITRILNAKETGIKTPNPEIDLLSPAELKEKAENLGLLGTDKRVAVWDALTSEQLNRLLVAPLATSVMTLLEKAYSKKRGFNTSMLGNKSIDEFLDSKPKFLKSSLNEESTWNEQKERAWLEKALPQFSSSERLLIVLTLKTLDGQDAYGLFWNNIITIARNAVRGTMYHEAFHGVVNALLTEQEHTNLFEAAIEKYGNLDIDELEERLAEDFRRYTKLLEMPIIGTLTKIFRKLKHFILNLVGNEPYINKLFYDINNGKFATRGIKESNILRYSQNSVSRLQSIVDNVINTAYPLNTRDIYTLLNSRIKRNAAWGRWRRSMESQLNATIKGYIDSKGNWRVASVTPNNPRYLRVNLGTNLEMLNDLQAFLDNFSIKINDINENYSGELPLFDAINRAINPLTVNDIPKGVGYAIAFMMLHHPEIEEIISLRVGIRDLKGFKRSIKVRGSYEINTKSIKYIKRNKELFDSYLHEIGDEIANELNKLYNGEPLNTEDTFLQKLWKVITEFFNKMTHSNRIYYSILSSYTKHIANAIKLNDATIILSTDNKPETTTEANLVDVGQALVDYPYEDSIIKKLNSEGIALAGGASIAISGTLYRPSENPLHDLDFNVGKMTRELLESILTRQGFNFMHFNTINDGEGKVTETYLVVDEPFEVKRVSPEIAANGIYSKATGELIGSYPNGLKNMEFISHGNHKGKFLDFFMGKNNLPYPNSTILVNGTDYLVASPLNAFKAKVEWARVKDIWDYNRFMPSDKTISRITIPNEELRERINKASIIWGHPALGKTTYLLLNNDILEWDDLVNSERFEFIRTQIDPNKTMDTSSKEYRQLQSDYMVSWREHPKYIDFLTEKWNWLKLKAKRENKKIMASPAPLLELFKDDFDLYITLTLKDFLARNMSRGGTFLGSLGWEQGLYDILSRVDQAKIARTNSYLTDIMSVESNTSLSRTDKLMFGFLTKEQQSYILSRISKDEYNDMSDNMKEVFLHCK